MTEEQILQGCIRKDIISQKQLYKLYAEKMLVVCARYAKDQMEAEDILQEAFLKVFDNVHKFRRECPLGAWIKRIMINTSINYYRKAQRQLYRVVDIDAIEDEFPHDSINEEYNLKDLLKMIWELPPGCRAIFNLFAIEGYSHKEISEMLEISEGTSKSQYARARNLLLNRIKKNTVAYEAIGQ